MGRNLKYQFKSAIESCFKESMDKHSLKHQQGIGGNKIFSYSDRKNLIDLSSNFSNFMKESHPTIKYIKEIKPQHIQQFLNSKSQDCSTKTLEQYVSKFNKLEKVVNGVYHAQVNFRSGFIVPNGKEKIRSIPMSRKDFNRLLSCVQGSKSLAVNAVILASIFGLRVSECVNIQGRDIQVDKGMLHIHESKGGRSRDLVIPNEYRQYMESLKSSVKDTERVIPIKEDSVNKFLSRQLEALGLGQYREHNTGIHSIRKMVAQEFFDNCRREGQTIQQSLNITSHMLGHGSGRNELMKHYVQNIK